MNSSKRGKVVATSKEVLFLTERSVISLPLIDKAPGVVATEIKGTIFTAAVVQDEAFILSAEHGFSRWESGKLMPVKGGDFVRTLAILPISDSKLAAATTNGILLLTIKNDEVSFEQNLYPDASLVGGRLNKRLESFGNDFYLEFDVGGVVKMEKDGQMSVWTEAQRELLGEDISAHIVDDAGHLWFASKSGVGVFSASRLSGSMARGSKPNSEAPPEISEGKVYLRNIKESKSGATQFGGGHFDVLGGVTTTAPSKLNFTKIAFENNALRFQFASDHIAESDNVEFQTMIDGLDSGWSEFSKRNSREVTNLIWKNYEFKMRAKFPDGTISREFGFGFQVGAPWNEQLWFHCLDASVFFGCMILVVWIRISKKWSKAEEPLNVIIVSTAVGYAFTKMGANSAMDSIAGGAAFLSILLGSLMGIFLKTIERKIEQFVFFVEGWIERHSREKGIMKVAIDEKDELLAKVQAAPSQSDSNGNAA